MDSLDKKSFEGENSYKHGRIDKELSTVLAGTLLLMEGFHSSKGLLTVVEWPMDGSSRKKEKRFENERRHKHGRAVSRVLAGPPVARGGSRGHPKILSKGSPLNWG